MAQPPLGGVYPIDPTRASADRSPSKKPYIARYRTDGFLPKFLVRGSIDEFLEPL